MSIATSLLHFALYSAGVVVMAVAGVNTRHQAVGLIIGCACGLLISRLQPK